MRPRSLTHRGARQNTADRIRRCPSSTQRRLGGNGFEPCSGPPPQPCWCRSRRAGPGCRRPTWSTRRGWPWARRCGSRSGPPRPRPRARRLMAAFAEFDRLESALSVWRAESDVQRLNAAAGGDAVAVGPDLLAVLDAAAEASRVTNGAFDITFGALSDVWRFDHDQDNRVPSPAEIAARLPLIDHAAVIDRPRHAQRAHHQAGREGAPGRHRQGLRRGSRGRAPARRRLRRLRAAGGRRPVCVGPPGRAALARGTERSARRGRRELRDHRASQRDVLDVRRLRAVLREGRRPLPPHPRPAHRPTRPPVPQRHHRRRRVRCRPTGSPPACSSWAPRKAWRSSSGCRTSKA